MTTGTRSLFRIAVATLLLFLAGGFTVFAGGARETEAPTLDIPTQQRQYISPGNGDGVQDVLELAFSSVVAPAENMVIVEYALLVFDADGNLVYQISEREEGRIGFFGGLFGGEKPRVQVPEELVWDGTYQLENESALPSGASNGDPVPDGEYTYQLSITDDADNSARSAPFAVTVDNQEPTIDEFPPLEYAVFSPNGDGVRDTIGVRASGSRELRWTVTLENESGATVYEQIYENATPRQREFDPAPPIDFRWDGRTGSPDEPGDVAGEGLYTVVLAGTDRAGNSAEARLEGAIRLSLTEAALSLEVEDGNPIFSPNDDGRRDDIYILLQASNADTIAEWTIEVLNASRVIRTESGTGAPPNRWLFDGRRADGSLLPDGEIALVFSAELDNGSVARSDSLTVVIDTVAPQATIVADTVPRGSDTTRGIVFGAGDRRAVEGSIFFERGVPWNYELRLDGRIIALGPVDDVLSSLNLTRRADGNRDRIDFVWDGSAVSGSGEAVDGVYEIVFASVDSAGNQGESQAVRVRKDGRTPSVDLAVDGRYLSPTINIRAEYGAPEIIEEFLFEIRDDRDRVVRSEYRREPFASFVWPGVTNGGTMVADGDYTASLRVVYLNGHEAERTNVGPIIVDRTGPRIDALRASYRSFSPDGDDLRDTVTIYQEVAPGDEWLGRIIDENGEVLLERRYSDTVEDLEWDGRRTDGSVVPDGDYRYVLSSTDAAGNSTSEAVLLTVDTEARGVGAQLSLIPIPFSPDGDGEADVLRIEMSVEGTRPVEHWTLSIMDPRGEEFRVFRGTGRPPASMIWDGTSDDGELVQSAMDYPVRLSAIDDQGNEAFAEAIASTDILVMREGDRYRIRISSIMFAPNTPDLFMSDEAQLDSNLDTLRRLARILNRYGNRHIVVEGHAAHVFLENPLMQREQEQVLLPLSRARATEVMQALIILGVDRNRMEIQAYGGDRPVVPHSDRANLWKNRRVEFLLDPESR